MADVRSALRQVPTGGVDAEDVPGWLAAGAVACGLGSSLLKRSDDEILARVSKLVGGTERG